MSRIKSVRVRDARTMADVGRFKFEKGTPGTVALLAQALGEKREWQERAWVCRVPQRVATDALRLVPTGRTQAILPRIPSHTLVQPPFLLV